MFVDKYYSQQGDRVSFTREQASAFAKGVADDFNPLHDVGAKRFCVPGDLLFSVILSHYGLSRHMDFTFSGMVVDGIDLVMPEAGESLAFDDTEGRHYLSVHRSGDNTRDASLIEELARSYVEFSGHTFPDILVPLLAEQQLMINPTRPMVMYESMRIDLERLDFSVPVLETERNELATDGKRGNVSLGFRFLAGGDVVGRGEKRMVLGGLRELDQQVVEQSVAQYHRLKAAYPSA
jgi:hypothetical protein